MRNLILSILTFSALTALGQTVERFDSTKVSAQVLEIVNDFEFEDGMVESAYVGYAGQPSEQFEVFERLYTEATESELLELTKHSEPIVRAYSFWGLAKINSNELETTLRQHLNDTTQVLTMSGCIVGIERVNTFMLDVVTPKLVDNCKKLSRRTLKELKEEIDAL